MARNNFFQKLTRRFVNRAEQAFPPYAGNEFQCPLCMEEIAFFLPIPSDFLSELNDNGYIHSIFQFETLNIAQYSCPACQGTDRDRLYAVFLNGFLKKQRTKIDLVEFAPSKPLTKIIQNFPFVRYRSADLYMETADDKVDLTQMSIYADAKFDFLICSHVLEHVEDDETAIDELYRILKPDGKGIVMVPIDVSLKETYENPEMRSEASRWKHFGQNDHVRLYSKSGFVERLEQSGFTVDQLGVDFFGEDVFQRSGIHPRSILYIVNKTI